MSPSPEILALRHRFSQQIGIAPSNHTASGFLRVVGFSIDLPPLSIGAFETFDSLVFCSGYDDGRDTIPPTNEYRFVLDCIEERAEAFSGGGDGHCFHISISSTELGQTLQQWCDCRALPGWTDECVRPHMVRGAAVDEARAEVRDLLAWSPVVIGGAVMERGWKLQDRYQLSYWDSLVVAAAKTAACGFLLTEDLQDGHELDGVEVVNPFLRGVRSVL